MARLAAYSASSAATDPPKNTRPGQTTSATRSAVWDSAQSSDRGSAGPPPRISCTRPNGVSWQHVSCLAGLAAVLAQAERGRWAISAETVWMLLATLDPAAGATAQHRCTARRASVVDWRSARTAPGSRPGRCDFSHLAGTEVGRTAKGQ
jgi:hypothetical protein